MHLNGPAPFISPLPTKNFEGRGSVRIQQPNFNVNSPLIEQNGAHCNFTDDLVPYNAKFNVLKFSSKGSSGGAHNYNKQKSGVNMSRRSSQISSPDT